MTEQLSMHGCATWMMRQVKQVVIIPARPGALWLGVRPRPEHLGSSCGPGLSSENCFSGIQWKAKRKSSHPQR